MEFHHIPVLLDEVLTYLQPQKGQVFIDGTAGGGGHSQAILQASPSAQLYAFDQDPNALQAAGERLAQFGERAKLIRSNFRHMAKVAQEQGIAGRVDGILLDIGVSSHQLDERERGFSYSQNAPLDMRMNPEEPLTAEVILNQWPEKEISRILYDYGEERWASRIAKFIVERRSNRQFQTTDDLVDVIRAAIPASARREGGNPAKRTFQGIRIAVNDELGALEEGLQGAHDILAPGGRLVVISFHSLEDRIVKNFIALRENGCTCPKELPLCACGFVPTLKSLTRKPVTGSDQELKDNSRAKSAKLRAAARL